MAASAVTQVTDLRVWRERRISRDWKSFRCAGLTFNPSYALSDSGGQVSVAVQLGSIPGSYQVLAETPKSGGGTVTVTSCEIALAYQEKLGKEVSEKYCTVCHDRLSGCQACAILFIVSTLVTEAEAMYYSVHRSGP